MRKFVNLKNEYTYERNASEFTTQCQLSYVSLKNDKLN